MSFGERFQALRRHNKLSHNTLAQRTGVSPKFLRSLEAKSKFPVAFYLVQRLASALQLRIHDICELLDIEPMFIVSESLLKCAVEDSWTVDEIRSMATLESDSLPSTPEGWRLIHSQHNFPF